MRIAVIGDHGHAVAAPFAGGLEAMTWYLSAWLADHGHELTLFAPSGSNVPGVKVVPLELDWGVSDLARRDVSMPGEKILRAQHAYLKLLKHLSLATHDFDVVHIHALHPLPVSLAHLTGLPTVLTLHSPPTPWLESALDVAGADAPYLVAVSRANQALWAESSGDVDVIRNGVDLGRWCAGGADGVGDAAVWAGRIVPEKAPHLAIAAARAAGLALRIAGPIEDEAYFRAHVLPLLGDGIDYVGRLSHLALSRLVARSSVLLQTPQWDEPFCLSAAEAIASGTPVAAFDRGGLREVVGRRGGVLTEPGDVQALARGALLARQFSRADVRCHAEATVSLDRCGTEYELLFERLSGRRHRRADGLSVPVPADG
jgi:glycosyltransferase involved in cell wall biosynthesis